MFYFVGGVFALKKFEETEKKMKKMKKKQKTDENALI